MRHRILVTEAVLAAVAVVATLVSMEASSRANGRFPASNMLVARPGDPTHLALRATYGLLLSSDSGATWDWVCERAVGYGGNEDPSIVIAGNGAIVVGSFTGTSRSIDGGCHWTHDPSWPSNVIDLASRPSAPDRLYAVTSVYAKAGDAGALFTSQLFVSDDAGAHWASRSTIDPTLLVDSVEVAPSDESRVYLSAIRPRGGATTGVLFVSVDGGAHWKERAIPFTPRDRGVYIAAVDPKNASRIYLRTNSTDASHLLVSDDGGDTVREILRGGPMRGFALADDGATVYAGGPNDGVLRAAASDLQFVKRSAAAVQCLTSLGSALWACTPTSAGYVLGASTDEGATFTERLRLAGMRGPLKCPAPSAIDVCAADWSAFRLLAGPVPVVDASVAPPSSHAANAPSRAPSSACGCALAGAPASKNALLALLFATLALVVTLRSGRCPRR